LHCNVIYTKELSKQAIEDHASTAFTVYSVNEGARLTLETLLTESVEDFGGVGTWLDQSMTGALRIANPPDCDFDMAVTLAGRISGTETSLSYNPSREIIHFIMMLEIEQAVLGYNIFAAVVLEHELLYISMMNNGVDIHVRSRDGLTALHVVVGNENIGLCEHLIHDGIDIGVRDIWGISPLLESVYYGHAEALKLLLANSTSPVDPDRFASPMQRGFSLGGYSHYITTRLSRTALHANSPGKAIRSSLWKGSWFLWLRSFGTNLLQVCGANSSGDS
jgi:hypothetical protein